MKAMTGFVFVGLLAFQWSCTSEVPRNLPLRQVLPVVSGYPAVRWDSTGTQSGSPYSGKADTVEYRGTTYLVQEAPIFTENEVKAVRKVPDHADMMEFYLNEKGVEALKAFSSDQSNIQCPMALRFGERWVSFPILQSRIPNGTFIMVGLTEEEYKQAEAAFGHM